MFDIKELLLIDALKFIPGQTRDLLILTEVFKKTSVESNSSLVIFSYK